MTAKELKEILQGYINLIDENFADDGKIKTCANTYFLKSHEHLFLAQPHEFCCNKYF